MNTSTKLHARQLAGYIAGLDRVMRKTVAREESREALARARRLLALVKPRRANEAAKIRLGWPTDGGYVMLDPGSGGIAYSFGVSIFSPWDLEMAGRGFRVYQYDGTVDSEPDKHPLISFNRLNIAGADPSPEGCTNIREILERHGHRDERDIVLQMDIEDAEWDFFEAISQSDLCRFKQIVVEFHNLSPGSGNYDRQVRVLEKLRRSHQPVHVHGNNYGSATLFAGSLTVLPEALEVTYARRKGSDTQGYTFSGTDECFPTPLDWPNYRRYPDIPLGDFSDIEDVD